MNICLNFMTPEKMQEFFRKLQHDPMATDEYVAPGYQYNEEQVIEYYTKQKRQGKQHFAIMLADAVIGDVYLKHIDQSSRTCELGIYIVNDNFKGKGYGTTAVQKITAYAFCEMKMNAVYADTLKKNIKCQRMLEKAGYIKIGSDEKMYYYKCDKAD